MMYPVGYFDPTYLLVIIGMVLCLLASAKVKSTYAKYGNVRSMSGLTARDVAEKILHDAGIYDVRIAHISGNLTDNYDPSNKVLHLSDSTYDSPSVAAIGVAAHECGHAIQHATSYSPLNLRKALVPVTNLAATISWPLILLGFILRGDVSVLLLNFGIIAFAVSVLFALVTLPVEFNASNRAVQILSQNGVLRTDEVSMVKKVLTAAAMTYVASAASSILNLLRIVLLSNNRRR